MQPALDSHNSHKSHVEICRFTAIILANIIIVTTTKIQYLLILTFTYFLIESITHYIKYYNFMSCVLLA